MYSKEKHSDRRVFLKNLFIFKGINKKLNILTKKVTIYKWAQLQLTDLLSALYVTLSFF